MVENIKSHAFFAAEIACITWFLRQRAQVIDTLSTANVMGAMPLITFALL